MCNYSGKRTKGKAFWTVSLLFVWFCSVSVCSCVCVRDVQTAHTSYPLYSVSLWVICMSLPLCFISEWLLRKLLHKMPVKMEKGCSTDLKKPSTLSIFSPYIVDEKKFFFCVCVCMDHVWGRVQEARCFSYGTYASVGLFYDSKIHAIPFLFPLSQPPCCSPSVPPLFAHLDFSVCVLMWSTSVKDNATVGKSLPGCIHNWKGHLGSVCF